MRVIKAGGRELSACDASELQAFRNTTGTVQIYPQSPFHCGWFGVQSEAHTACNYLSCTREALCMGMLTEGASEESEISSCMILWSPHFESSQHLFREAPCTSIFTYS